MNLKILLLVISSCNWGLVPALSIPAAIQLLPNTTSPEIAVANGSSLGLFSFQNATGLTAPPPPADFNMEYRWEDVTMDWCQVYINTIELMADLASQDWDGELYGPEPLEIYGGPRFTTQIFVFPVLPSIKNKYLVWALYQIGLQLTVRHASQRTEFLAGISLQRQRIGFFTYTNRQPGLANYPANSTHLLDGSYPANNTSTTASRQPSDLHVPSTNSILRAKYARVVDRDDRKLKIEYEFDGVKIAPARVFSAYMDALAIAAPHNSNEAGATVAARSADGRVSINVRRNPTYYNFTWGELVKALSTIWRQVIIRYDSLADARWEGMSFLIEYNGRLVGEGFLVCYD